MARAAVGVAGISLVVALLALLFTPTNRNQVAAYEDTCTDPPPVPGAARSWEAAIPVSTYSWANTRSGNLHTVIPIIGWTGMGPDMGMALYHNSASVSKPGGWTTNVGFNLGPGWTVAYSHQLFVETPNEDPVTVVHADGTEDVYTWNSTNSEYDPPAGVWDRLEYHTGTPDYWSLTRKDQTSLHFEELNGAVKLVRRVDAVGIVANLDYGTYLDGGLTKARLLKVWASNREVEFLYDAEDKDLLLGLLDPREEEGCEPDCTIDDRQWDFEYSSGRLLFITDPMGYKIKFTYDTDGRIATITDKHVGNSDNADKYIYEYFPSGGSYLNAPGRIKEVTDPLSREQSFSTQCFDDEMYFTKYLNRRGLEWRYFYFSPEATTNNLYPDGNIGQIWPPEKSAGQSWWWDADRNPIVITDGYGNGYELAYDGRGNRTERWDAYDVTETWTYDEFNNRTSYTDQLEKTWEYYYDHSNTTNTGVCSMAAESCRLCDGGSNDGLECDTGADCPGGTCEMDDSVCARVCIGGSNDEDPCDGPEDCPGGTCPEPTCDLVVLPPVGPTLLTRIVEPPAASGGASTTTTIDYFLNPNDESNYGQISQITDAVGVITTFEYDDWGQRAIYREGEYTSGSPPETNYIYCESTQVDSGGRTVQSGHYCDGIGGTYGRPSGSSYHVAQLDSNNRQTGSSCGGIAAMAYRAEEEVTLPILPCSPMEFPLFAANFEGAIYSPKDELLNLPLTIYKDGVPEALREFTHTYDKFGRSTSSLTESDESGDDVAREFEYGYHHGTSPNETDFWVVREGPDDVDTLYVFNKQDLVSYIRKGPSNDPVYEATFTYFDNGTVESVTYGNGKVTNYEYDHLNRVAIIDHANMSNLTFLMLGYEYTDTGLPSIITEYGPAGEIAETEYTYDYRGRLTKELRTGSGQTPYEVRYEYDQVGNRTKRRDFTNELRDVYVYDYSNPTQWESKNNRLVYYTTHNGHTTGPAQSVTRYYYNAFGNTAYIVTGPVSFGGGSSMMGGGEGGGEESMEGGEELEGGGESMMMGGLLSCPEGSDELSATRFEYAANGRTVTYAISESWCWDGDEENCPTDYTVHKVEHYRYDGARQRYLVQDLDPDDLDAVLGEYWSDYDGDDVYGDFEIDEGNGVTIRSFEAGLARVDGAMSEGDGNTDYYHTDHLGTTRRMTAANASVIDAPVFTAFGERRTSGISDPFDRYGYVGTHGYQEQTGFFHEFSHVGHRFYQPRIGRFLQRDPIGVRGGISVYIYVDSSPMVAVDPYGLINDNSLLCPGPYGVGNVPCSGKRPPRKPVPPPSTVGGPTAKDAMKGAGVLIAGAASAGGAGLAWGGAGAIGAGLWGYDEAVDFFTFFFYYPIAACR